MASALTTLSARDMIEALINGERDPAVLAELARGRMRSKIPDLRLACAGRFGAQHALMCTLHPVRRRLGPPMRVMGLVGRVRVGSLSRL